MSISVSNGLTIPVARFLLFVKPKLYWFIIVPSRVASDNPSGILGKGENVGKPWPRFIALIHKVDIELYYVKK